jgi:hypothetical protein
MRSPSLVSIVSAAALAACGQTLASGATGTGGAASAEGGGVAGSGAIADGPARVALSTERNHWSTRRAATSASPAVLPGTGGTVHAELTTRHAADLRNARS